MFLTVSGTLVLKFQRWYIPKYSTGTVYVPSPSWETERYAGKKKVTGGLVLHTTELFRLPSDQMLKKRASVQELIIHDAVIKTNERQRLPLFTSFILARISLLKLEA
jgi:hypothetical protein